MSEIEMLVRERDNILEQIREIEENCEGISNENNFKKVQSLNLEKAKLVSKIDGLKVNLSSLNSELKKVDSEIDRLSVEAKDRILEAIKNQRWYFFKNKPKVLMDKNTGLLWANLDYFPYCRDVNSRYRSDFNLCENIINKEIDGYSNWRVPTAYELWDMIEDKTFPFIEGNNWRIKNWDYWFIKYQNQIRGKDLDDDGATNDIEVRDACLLPCNDSITYEDYKKNISDKNPIYTERERLQFTLDLFVENELWPIFDDETITILYKKIYLEKRELLKKLADMQARIDELQEADLDNKALLSSKFKYEKLLEKYDLEAIDNSIIKYYKAVISWVDELVAILESFQNEKKEMIEGFNSIGIKLSKKYQENPNLTTEENELLKYRQKFFKKNFELGIHDVSKKLLAYKTQAENIEDRIEEINEGVNGIIELAELEQEKRASFAFIAENTANIVLNALKKIEYFDENREFAEMAIDLWDKWSEDYRILKTAYREDLKNISQEEEIEEEIWTKWFDAWCKVRFKIEEQFLPIIARGIDSSLKEESKGIEIIEEAVNILNEYRDKVDAFYKEERKNIYQKYAFAPKGELQEKFEVELEMHKISSDFQQKLQKIIFKLEKNENKIFLINWANNIIDLPVDEIIMFIEDNNLEQIPQNVLTQFAELKTKNFEAYLSDAKAYAKEQERRDKEYTSLVFKMRKGLNK